MSDVIKIDDVEKQIGSETSFSGEVTIQTIAPTGASVARVTFHKGARTFWHTHSGGQILYFLEGKGRVQIEGQEIINANPGDIVHIPAKTRHWHGASPEEEDQMRHLAITYGEITWMEPTTEEEYNINFK